MTAGILGTVVALVFQPTPTLGQAVRGTISEWMSDRAVERCRVVLLNEDEEEVAESLSDESGDFVLTAPAPGTYVLYVTRIGYHPLAEGPVTLQPNDTVDVVYVARPVAVALNPITVRTVRVIRYLENAGFYERQKSQRGFFLGPAEIEERMYRATRVTDLLHGIPGLTVLRAPAGQFGSTVRLRGIASLRGCRAPKIYVDGLLAYDPLADGYMSLDELVDRYSISAIEVYRRPAELPAQYGGAESACGVMLVWTGRR